MASSYLFSVTLRALGAVAVAGVLLALPVEGATESPHIYRSGVDLVHLNVVVTDRQGEYATALGPEDFVVLEDGVPQRLEFAMFEDVPLDLAILLDTSGSMAQHMPTLQRAAMNLLRVLRPGDRGLVAEFTDGLRILADFTGDIRSLEQAVRRTAAHGHTAVYRAMYVMLRTFDRTADTTASPFRRRAMMVFSDGVDNRSGLGIENVLQLAREMGVPIYPVVLGSPTDRRVMNGSDAGRAAEITFDMNRLARETGTRAFFPAQVEELAGVYSDIVRELSHQYVLGYVSTKARRDGAFRRVAVHVAGGLQARTRAEYLAPEAGTRRSRLAARGFGALLVQVARK